MKIKSSELYLTIALFAICCLMDTGLTIYRIIGLALLGIAVLHVLFQKQIVVTAPIVNFWSWFIPYTHFYLQIGVGDGGELLSISYQLWL